MKYVLGLAAVLVAVTGYALYSNSVVTGPSVAELEALTTPTTPDPEMVNEGMQLAQAFSKGGVPKALEIQPDDRVMGDMDAPVTIVEYASMTCPHCADFHKDILSKVKTEYIETGKVKYVLRDLAWDSMAFGISIVARCAPEEKFYPLVDAFFKTQDDWLREQDALMQIKKIARLVGVTGSEVDACLGNKTLQASVQESRRVAQQELNVKGTPTVFVNGERVDRLRDFDDLKEVIDAALAKGRVHS